MKKLKHLLMTAIITGFCAFLGNTAQADQFPITELFGQENMVCQTYDEHMEAREKYNLYIKMYFNINDTDVLAWTGFQRIDVLIQGDQVKPDAVSDKHYNNFWTMVLVRNDQYCILGYSKQGWGTNHAYARHGLEYNGWESISGKRPPRGWRMIVVDEDNNIINNKR